MIVYPNHSHTVHSRNAPLWRRACRFGGGSFFCMNIIVRYGMDNTIWHDGYPKRQGFYNCLIDGELEMRLKFYVCQVSCKPHWVDNHGDYIEDMGKVQWTGEPLR